MYGSSAVLESELHTPAIRGKMRKNSGPNWIACGGGFACTWLVMVILICAVIGAYFLIFFYAKSDSCCGTASPIVGGATPGAVTPFTDPLSSFSGGGDSGNKVIGSLTIEGDFPSLLNPRMTSSGVSLKLNAGNAEFPFQVYAGQLLTQEPVSTVSDIRLKKDIEYIDSKLSLDIILGLKSAKYKLISPLSDSNRTDHFGFIAQDIQDLSRFFPDTVGNLVRGNINLSDETRGDPYLSVNYIEVIPFLVSSIQEIHKSNELLTQVVHEQRDLIYTLLESK